MATPAQIANIIAEIDAGGRVMPPVSERIKQRDAMLAARQANAPIQPAKPQAARDTTRDPMDAGAYYDEKRLRGDNYTMD